MSEILIYIPIFLVLLIAVALKAKYDVRRRREMLHEALELESSREEMSVAERETRRLLGDQAYDEMVERVKRLLHNHDGQKSVTVNLTGGPSNAKGRERLHSLLPGDPLWLRENSIEGVRNIDVYSSGYKIGALMLNDADTVLEVMDTAKITGAYVAEQNSYGESDMVSLRVILFFIPDAEESKAARRAHLFAEATKLSPYKITLQGDGHNYTLFQN